MKVALAALLLYAQYTTYYRDAWMAQCVKTEPRQQCEAALAVICNDVAVVCL